MTLTHKLQKLALAALQGKRSVVKVNGIPYRFIAVYWGGASPTVRLELPDGSGAFTKTAAEWRRFGAAL